MRYADLVPCLNAFIDTRTPGSERKENFTIIGPGVSENPAQHVHIALVHGFNIGGARQPPGCVNSQHSHLSAEVFVAHSGRWRFDIGETGDAAHVFVEPGDVISLPTGMFRGFTNIGEETGFLWSVLGGDDPGRVTWAPQVFDLAQEHGLVLLDTGRLIDTRVGEAMPPGARPMPRTAREQVAAMRTPSQAQADALVARAAPARESRQTAIIGPHGALDWEHGFTMDRIDLASDGTLDGPGATTPSVLFVHSGRLAIAWNRGGAQLILGLGDTLSVPVGLPLRLAAECTTRAFRVCGVP